MFSLCSRKPNRSLSCPAPDQDNSPANHWYDCLLLLVALGERTTWMDKMQRTHFLNVCIFSLPAACMCVCVIQSDKKTSFFLSWGEFCFRKWHHEVRSISERALLMSDPWCGLRLTGGGRHADSLGEDYTPVSWHLDRLGGEGGQKGRLKRSGGEDWRIGWERREE